MHARLSVVALVTVLAACGGGSTPEEIITCQTSGACSFEVISGTGQSGAVGTFLNEDLVIEVRHRSGMMPRPVSVRWSVVSGGGTVTASVAEIGPDEMFQSSTRALLGTMAGEQTFRATLVEDPSVIVDFSATASPGAPRRLEPVSGNNQRAEVGTALAEPFVVQVLDEFGNPVPEVRVGWSESAGDGTITFESVATDAQGMTEATATVGEAAGEDNNLYVAEAPTIQNSPEVRFVASAFPGAASAIAVADGDEQGGVREEMLPLPLRVLVTDRFNNPVANEPVNFTSLTDGASVMPAVAFTDMTGTASAGATLGSAGGEYRFRAELPNRGSVQFVANAFPPLCSDDDWCWVAPIPQGNTLNDSHSTTDDDVWVVGDYGTVLRWQGVAWETFETNTVRNLNGVHAAGPNDAWAVGDSGTILRFDGTRWRVVDSGVLFNLNDIWVASANFAVAVGDSGAILTFDGNRWSQVLPSPVLDQLNGVWGVSTREIYVAGDNGQALFFDGTAWQRLTTPNTNDLNGVWGTAADNVWFVGDRETFLRWQGSVFETFPSNSNNAIRGVWGRAENLVFAVGDRGRVRRFDGGQWRAEISRTPNGLRSVTGFGSGVLAVGEGGVLVRRPENAWQLETSRRLNTLENVWGTAPDAMWAVGAFGTVLSWNGGVWQEVDIGINTSDLIGLHGSAADDIWAVGENGTALRYTGEERGWSLVRSGTEETLNAVYALSSTIAYAVGDRATILRWNGVEWSSMPAPATVFGRLNGVWAASSNQVWAVGDSGVLLRFDGVSWSEQTRPTGNALLGVKGRSANEVFAWGFGGALFRFDGTTWTQVVLNTNALLFSMHFAGPSEAWLAGEDGVILRNQGAGWLPQESGTNNDLFGIFGVEPDDVWVVGLSGTIIRRNPDDMP